MAVRLVYDEFEQVQDDYYEYKKPHLSQVYWVFSVFEI